MQPYGLTGILRSDAAPLAAPKALATPCKSRTGVRFGLRRIRFSGHLRSVGRGKTVDVSPEMTLARSQFMSDAVERPDLLLHLRRATAAAHQRLEEKLDLISQLSDRQAVLRVLERFYGFHVVWEAAIRRRPELRAFHEPRARLPHLRRDLAMLGRTPDDIARLAVCAPAARLAETSAAALGSFYVVEGSTLGGQVIGRGLAAAGWAPPEGLSYFTPYGAGAGEMWRAFRQWAGAQDDAGDPDAVAAGAARTFELLTGWLA